MMITNHTKPVEPDLARKELSSTCTHGWDYLDLQIRLVDWHKPIHVNLVMELEHQRKDRYLDVQLQYHETVLQHRKEKLGIVILEGFTKYLEIVHLDQWKLKKVYRLNQQVLEQQLQELEKQH
ncbi:hypothetical protein Tco_1183975 [Tanacetum coccineum]